jgi:predicted lipoprotein with Yx(FWY)xxD motif
MSYFARTGLLRWRFLAALVFAGAVIAACSSASTGTTATAPSTPASSGGSGPVVMTKTGPAGTYLTDGDGKTLYLFAPDTGGKSVCNGPCAQAWPPLMGTATAGTGVTGSMLGTTTRDDGSIQVTYNNHPLYYFIKDKAPGDTVGQGVNAFGGLWWLVAPGGTPIQTASSGAPTPAPSPTTNGPGGY